MLVVAALLVKEDRLLIARRAPGESLAGQWEFPGGKVRAQERPEAALARELDEEFGIRVRTGAFFGESLHHYRHALVRLWAYWARWRTGHIRLSVHDRYAWVGIDDLGRYCFAEADVPFIRALEEQSQRDDSVLKKAPAEVLPRCT